VRRVSKRDAHTLCFICESLTAYNALLLVVDKFDALSIEGFLEFCKVDVCGDGQRLQGRTGESILFQVKRAPEKLYSAEPDIVILWVFQVMGTWRVLLLAIVITC
jgi:hypothetical protein